MMSGFWGYLPCPRFWCRGCDPRNEFRIERVSYSEKGWKATPSFTLDFLDEIKDWVLDWNWRVMMTKRTIRMNVADTILIRPPANDQRKDSTSECDEKLGKDVEDSGFFLGGGELNWIDHLCVCVWVWEERCVSILRKSRKKPSKPCEEERWWWFGWNRKHEPWGSRVKGIGST